MLLIAGATIVLRPAQRPAYSFAAISGSGDGPAGSSRTNGAGIVEAYLALTALDVPVPPAEEAADLHRPVPEMPTARLDT
ncbi:hypothetical protein [Pseudonocardia sp. T1-2H]|uniref:hypothetical protein n=1 Tax=Pseudonocardia sp. T1-2H TaxID=3128899 RepID=UPI003100E373